ncbi:hypothetical protein [Arthrobacter sp. ZBG10]|uniref:hypothetical protein n=1 Tax=Arthrobacter sp. ZBG10 TaxID=1676590 RepID=UPI0012FBDDC9|nr:hypothetical protein [Arthrobacter sp. ZBG10]
MLKTQGAQSKAFIYTLVLTIGLVYIAVFFQLGNAGESGSFLKWVFTVGSLVAGLLGLFLLVDWRNLGRLVSKAGRRDWAGLILGVVSLALGVFALWN